MTISDTAVPAAGSHPYPDLAVLPEAWVTDLTATYEAMAAKERAANDEWEIGARARVFPQPGRHAARPAPAVAPERAVTVPDALPVPDAVPSLPGALVIPEPLRAHRPSWFAKHGRHASGPKRDQPPERAESAWQPPEGRNGTVPHPAADSQEAPTILPGDMAPIAAEDDPAAAAVQAEAARALQRVPGVRAADLAHLARPGDGRDATTEMTAVTERPAGLGESNA